MTPYATDKLEKNLNFDLCLAWCLILKLQYIVNDVLSLFLAISNIENTCLY